MTLIATDTLAQAWLNASLHLASCSEWTDTTVVLHIATPMVVRPEDYVAADILDEFLIKHDRYSHHTVAETLFPGYEYVTHGVEGVYRIYPEDVFPRLKNHKETRHWGTYAYRLLRRAVTKAARSITHWSTASRK